MQIKFTINNLLAAAAFLLLVGCASTAQQVGDNKYRTDCSGVFNSISECYAEATRVCEGNFNEIDRQIIIRTWFNFFIIFNTGKILNKFFRCLNVLWLIYSEYWTKAQTAKKINTPPQNAPASAPILSPLLN